MFTDACIDFRHDVLSAESDAARGAAVARFRERLASLPPAPAGLQPLYDAERKLLDDASAGLGTAIADGEPNLRRLLRLADTVRATLDAVETPTAAIVVARAKAGLAAAGKRIKVLQQRDEDLSRERLELQGRLSAIDRETAVIWEEFGTVFTDSVKAARAAGIDVNVPAYDRA